MGGKAALLLVLGFSMIFLVLGHNFGNLSSRAIENMSNYYEESIAYNIAVTGANMAASQVFMDKTWEEGYADVKFDNGTLNVYVSNPQPSMTPVQTKGKKGKGGSSNPNKTVICHIPPGNPAAAHTIEVGNAAVPAHLNHGDYVGPCSGEVVDSAMVVIISEGTYQGITKTVQVELRPSHFSKFGNYYSSITAYPATGDTFNGPFHTNGLLTTYGQPVFNGKVTSKNGLSKKGAPPKPEFNGGFESGIDIPLEFDTSGMRVSASKIFADTLNKGKDIDVRLVFNADGTVTHSFSINDGKNKWTTPVTEKLTDLAPNGLIYIEKGNAFVSGVVKGEATVVATKQGKSGRGEVYFEDNLTYATDPRKNPNSKDVLGIVAESDIRIQYNANTNSGKNIETWASMFAMNGTIGPEDYFFNKYYYNHLAQWNILGGLIADGTRQTAVYSGSKPVRGLKFVHSYDSRFLTYVPPFFPHTKSFEVVSWYE